MANETGMVLANGMGAGQVNTTRADGGQGSAVIMETGLVQDRINNIIQFSINNSGVGNADQLLRIGSRAGMPDTFARFGLVAGAADDTVIVDDFGAGCLKIQGFSDIVSCKPVIVTKIKLKTATADIQLDQPVQYKSLQLDGSVDALTNNVGWTAEKVDNRDNLVEVRGVWVLDSQQFIEYKALATKVFTVMLEVTGFSNIATFKPITY